MNAAVTPVALSLEAALALLQGDDLGDRYYAAWYLGTLKDRRAVPALILALDDEADRTALGGYPLRRNAAKALGVIGDPEAVPALVKALSSADYFLQEEAAYALAAISDPSALEGVRALFATPEAEYPWEALIRALGSLGAQETAPLIRPFLHHASERVQAAAAGVLYRFTGEESLAEQLVRGLQHDNVNVRRAVLTDLGETGYVPAAEAMTKADVAVSLKLNALKRLFDVAIQGQSSTQVPRIAKAVMPWIEALL
ncbi:MAG: HEAT repeat domain-containing protein [Synechococcales cyanobacterium]